MMRNPVLQKLGFDANDRVVLIHADDVGMCHATVPAFFELATAGQISAGSTMVPCPWFGETGALWRRHPGVDLGVHLTLTSEWDTYRWRPLTACDASSGVTDLDGYFYRAPAMMQRPDASVVRCEMYAQVQRARDAGIDVTHIDCHMFAMLAHGLVDTYVALGAELGVPVLMTRQPAWIEVLGPEAIDRWEEMGTPVFDHIREMPLDQAPEGLLDTVRNMFTELPAGLTYLILHPALDTPELRAIGGDWRQRVSDYETFRNPELHNYLRSAGIHTVGWREIRDLMKGS